ncbi:MAG: hypothetical protein IKQ46_02710 [Bacteroidales bacterium]|jgi:hypothetical protein|nr:hypothetical protein [Bacteroidales bacterium]
MFKLKLNLLVGLISYFTFVGCSMDDDAVEVGTNSGNQDPNATSKYEAGFLIGLDHWGYSSFSSQKGLNFSLGNADTLYLYPDDVVFNNEIKNFVVGAHDRVYELINSLFISNSQNWMDLTLSYSGTYTSNLDSRIKQWAVDSTDIKYDDVNYGYCLKIHDLPEGASSSGNSNLAMVFCYDKNFQKGVMVFSPVNYDKIDFPLNYYGSDLMARFYFHRDGKKLYNELYLTNVNPLESSVSSVHNYYLSLIFDSETNIIDFSSMIYMPNLWFDTPNNSGYTICLKGVIDTDNSAQGATLVYTGLVKNNSTETDYKTLIESNSAGYVLAELYPSWKNAVADKRNLSDNNDNGEDGDSGENGENDETGEGKISPPVIVEEDSKSKLFCDISTFPESQNVEPLFKNPSYYYSHYYVGPGKVDNASQQNFNKVLKEAGGFENYAFPLSPAKQSSFYIKF